MAARPPRPVRPRASQRGPERIRLIVWNTQEAETKARVLNEAGYDVDAPPLSAGTLRAMRASPPAAVVIDLGRLPSQGRDVGVHIRHSASTCAIPIVFVGGEGEKLDRIRALLPDAVYATWPGIAAAIRSAIDMPPSDPVRTSSGFAAYAGKPLPERLGIRAGAIVELAGAPDAFERTLGTLPDRVQLRRRPVARPDLILWFPRNLRDLESRVGAMAKRTPRGGLWIVWPKTTSTRATDLTQTAVRRTGLAAGLVDYRIVRIDETWAGLRFARRASRD